MSHKERKNQIPVNSYVQLKDGFDETDMYRSVDAGATGWVRDRKIDDYGFAMIFIEWDEANPKYAGEIDKWAFESHFKILSSKYDKSHTAERYIESIRFATDEALVAEGFVLITMNKKIDANGRTLYEPGVFSGQLNDEAALILEAQIAYMASTLLQGYIQDTLNTIKTNKIKGDDDESRR